MQPDVMLPYANISVWAWLKWTWDFCVGCETDIKKQDFRGGYTHVKLKVTSWLQHFWPSSLLRGNANQILGDFKKWWSQEKREIRQENDYHQKFVTISNLYKVGCSIFCYLQWKSILTIYTCCLHMWKEEKRGRKYKWCKHVSCICSKSKVESPNTNFFPVHFLPLTIWCQNICHRDHIFSDQIWWKLDTAFHNNAIAITFLVDEKFCHWITYSRRTVL